MPSVSAMSNFDENDELYDDGDDDSDDESDFSYEVLLRYINVHCFFVHDSV